MTHPTQSTPTPPEAHTETSLTLVDTQPDSPVEHADLPPANTRRWDTKRKAQVVEAVRSGCITLEQACDIYAMSVDEFLGWQSLFDRYGAKGLMATRVKEFRDRRMFA